MLYLSAIQLCNRLNMKHEMWCVILLVGCGCGYDVRLIDKLKAFDDPIDYIVNNHIVYIHGKEYDTHGNLITSE